MKRRFIILQKIIRDKSKFLSNSSNGDTSVIQKLEWLFVCYYFKKRGDIAFHFRYSQLWYWLRYVYFCTCRVDNVTHPAPLREQEVCKCYLETKMLIC